MIRINTKIRPADFSDKLNRLWQLSATKIRSLENSFDLSSGSPVCTVQGRYQSRDWTEWTLGFHFGSAILQFDATGDLEFLEAGRNGTLAHMPSRLTHMGVHDHGFNNVSTYGNLLRLLNEGRFEAGDWQRKYYELALKCSAAVQARRWTSTPEGGFIYSFNGPHSLFADTLRSLRSLAIGYTLGHELLEENDRHISLLERLIQHAGMTARYSVYYGDTRDIYDVPGRVAHECIFNLNDGLFRCPSTQQGYSSRSTWTRALAWIILGYAEQLEFLNTVSDQALEELGGRDSIEAFFLRAGTAASDHYLETSPTNGIPYWDTGAPGLEKIGAYREIPADPFNEYEPVDSSAAAIVAQGLFRLGRYLTGKGELERGERYWQAGLTILDALFDPPYISLDENHQGLILHSVYHRPNGWDYVPPGRKVPCGESSMWGDYHAREVALYLKHINDGAPYLTFWGGMEKDN